MKRTAAAAVVSFNLACLAWILVLTLAATGVVGCGGSQSLPGVDGGAGPSGKPGGGGAAGGKAGGGGAAGGNSGSGGGGGGA
jgi:hypothetical protein